ncbi:hypothetical protein ABT168_18470, partial [Streptomyces sp. NPDC001793]
MSRRATAWVHGPAAVLACWSLGHTLWHGLAAPRTALAFGVLIAAGEAVRRIPARPAAARPDRHPAARLPRAPDAAAPGPG